MNRQYGVPSPSSLAAMAREERRYRKHELKLKRAEVAAENRKKKDLAATTSAPEPTLEMERKLLSALIAERRKNAKLEEKLKRADKNVRYLRKKCSRLSRRLALRKSMPKLTAEKNLQLYVEQGVSLRRMRHLKAFLSKNNIAAMPTMASVDLLRR